MAINLLTDARIRAARFQGKAEKLSDGGGLFLHVLQTKKVWRYRFKMPKSRQEQTLTLGDYGNISLADARRMRDEARKLVAQGINPCLLKKERHGATGTTFKDVALDYLEHYKKKTKPITHGRNVRRLEMHAFPTLAHKEIREITSAEILSLLATLADSPETQNRVKTLISQVFNHAIATGHTDSNPTLALRGYTASVKRNHRPGITKPLELGKLLLAIDTRMDRAELATKLALQLAPLVFWRTSNLRYLTWDQIDWTGDCVNFAQAKVDDPLYTPLSRQAKAILQTARNVYEHSSQWVFPSRNRTDPMSENALNQALERLGYKGLQTVNGFRAVAQTLLLEELRYPLECIEMQLGHKPPGKYGKAYNRAEWREKRIQMMQEWADYLDKLKAEAAGQEPERAS